MSPDLKPGSYSLRVTREGFEPLVKTVDLHGMAELELKLAVASKREEVTVSGKGRAYANTRSHLPATTDYWPRRDFPFDDFTMHLDAGTFHFQKGTLTVLNPVTGSLPEQSSLGKAISISKQPLRSMAPNLNGVQGTRKLTRTLPKSFFVSPVTEEAPGSFLVAVKGESRDSGRRRQHLRSLEGKGAENARGGARFHRVPAAWRNHGQCGRRLFWQPSTTHPIRHL